jgi:hypothetical protein
VYLMFPFVHGKTFAGSSDVTNWRQIQNFRNEARRLTWLMASLLLCVGRVSTTYYLLVTCFTAGELKLLT